MNKAAVLSIARRQLSDAICQDQPPIGDPLKVSPWIAMSLLQKALRRGRKNLACRAAATLFRRGGGEGERHEDRRRGEREVDPLRRASR